MSEWRLSASFLELIKLILERILFVVNTRFSRCLGKLLGVSSLVEFGRNWLVKLTRCWLLLSSKLWGLTLVMLMSALFRGACSWSIADQVCNMVHFPLNRSLEFGNRGLLFPVCVSCLQCGEYLDNNLISFDFCGNLVGVEIEDVVSNHCELRYSRINTNITISVIEFELVKVQMNSCAEVDKFLVVLSISATLFNKRHVKNC